MTMMKQGLNNIDINLPVNKKCEANNFAFFIPYIRNAN